MSPSFIQFLTKGPSGQPDDWKTDSRSFLERMTLADIPVIPTVSIIIAHILESVVLPYLPDRRDNLDSSLAKRVRGLIWAFRFIGRGLSILEMIRRASFASAGPDLRGATIPSPSDFLVPLRETGPVLVFAALLIDILRCLIPYRIANQRLLDFQIRSGIVMLTFLIPQRYFAHTAALLIILAFPWILFFQEAPEVWTKDPDDFNWDKWNDVPIVSASWWQEGSLWKHEFIIAELRRRTPSQGPSGSSSDDNEDDDELDILFVRIEREKDDWLSILGNLQQIKRPSFHLDKITPRASRIARLQFADDLHEYPSLRLLDRMTENLKKRAPHYVFFTFNCWWFAQACFWMLASSIPADDHQLSIFITSSTPQEWTERFIYQQLSAFGYGYWHPISYAMQTLLPSFVPGFDLWDGEYTETLDGLGGFCDRWKRRHAFMFQRSWLAAVYRIIVLIRIWGSRLGLASDDWNPFVRFTDSLLLRGYVAFNMVLSTYIRMDETAKLGPLPSLGSEDNSDETERSITSRIRTGNFILYFIALQAILPFLLWW